MRNLATCLNGTEGAIQPYVDFLEKSVSDADLKVLLDIYNKHLVKESRFRKVFDFIDYLNQKNLSGDFYKNLSYLTQTRSLQTLLPVLAVMYAEEENGTRPIDAINEYLRVFIENEELNRAVISLANLLGSGRSRWMTYMGANYFSSYPQSVDTVVDDLSNGVYQAIQSNGWQEFLLLMTDPIVHPILLRMIEEDQGVAAYGTFIKKLFTQKQGQTSFSSLIDLSVAADAPTPCWGDEAVSDNLFQHVFDTLAKNGNITDFETELLQRIPSLYFLSRNACNFDSRIRNNISIPTYLAREGMGDSMFKTVNTFKVLNRDIYIKKLLTSVNIKSINSILQNFTHSDMIFYALEVLQKDLSMQDFISFHRMIRNMFIEDLPPYDLVTWVERTELSIDTKIHILNLVQQNRLSLHALIDYLMNDQNEAQSHIAYTELILYLSQIEMAGAPGAKLQTMMMKLFGPNYTFRKNLKDFVATYIESLSREDAGWGDLLGSVGEAIVQTGEAPFVDFIKDLITDREFVAAMNPILEKFFKDPLFLRSLAFTGELAENGELRRLISFFIQVAKSIDVPGLSMYPSPYQFTKYRGSLHAFKKEFKFNPPNRQEYSSCWNLSNDTSSASVWLDFVSCINANDTYPTIDRVFTEFKNVRYKNRTLLEAVTSTLEQVLASPAMYPFLQTINVFKAQISEVHRIFKDILFKYDIFGSLDKIISSISLDVSFKKLLLKSSEILSEQNIATLFKETIYSYSNFEDPQVVIPANYTSQIKDANGLFKKAQAWRKDLDYSEIKGSAPTIENLWSYASNNFSKRNWAYQYQSGVYLAPTEDVQQYYETAMVEFLQLSARPGNFEALVSAFKTLRQENFPFADMLRWFIEEQDVIKYYTFNLKEPTIRLVTPADKLEILVQNAQIGVASWAGSLGADHIATFFQYEIANSKNLTETLKKLKGKISQGISYSSLTGNRKKLNHLRNIEQTFSALDDMNRKGYLRFLQVIYKNLLDVTPAEYKEKQDPILNHMGLAHHLAKVGLFMRSVHGLEILTEQNKLDLFVTSFERMIDAISMSDIRSMRQIVDVLHANSATRFKDIFSIFWKSVPEEKETIFATFTVNTILLTPKHNQISGLLSAANTLVANRLPLLFATEKLMDVATDVNSIAAKILFSMGQVANPAARDSLIRNALLTSSSLIEELAYLFVVAYSKQPEAINTFYNDWSLAIHDQDIDFGRMRESLYILCEAEERQRTILPFFVSLLGSEERADIFANALYEISKNQQSSQLVTEYFQFMINGEFSSILEYLDAFKPSNSRVSNF